MADSHDSAHRARAVETAVARSRHVDSGLGGLHGLERITDPVKQEFGGGKRIMGAGPTTNRSNVQASRTHLGLVVAPMQLPQAARRKLKNSRRGRASSVTRE